MAVDVLSLVTEEEKDMMSRYIKLYAVPENATVSHFASMDHILREWRKCKNLWLGKIFNKDLILSETISYSASKDEIYMSVVKCPEYQRFVEGYKDWIRSHRLDFGYQVCSHLSMLISGDSIATNKYDGESFEIPDPSRPGKNLKIPCGCKSMKMIGKIYNLYAPHIGANYEDFRIAISQILNTASVSGNLCLSIHPFDYMTMSDNNCDWESCMNWISDGSYRQGTVEMMNSKYVVVAYLTAKEDMLLTHDIHWNNKKWRSLYIVHPNFIGNIKGYPYQIPEIDKIVIEKLRKLVEAHTEHRYKDVESYQFDSDNRTHFRTDYMYNDFGSLKENFACFGTESEEININYSGASECMVCGYTNISIEHEELLLCEDCYCEERCDCCGDSYAGGLIETSEGTWVCESCLNEYYANPLEDEDEYYLKDNMQAIYVLPDELKPFENDISLRNSYNIPHFYTNKGYDLDDKSERKCVEQYFLKRNHHIIIKENNYRWSSNNTYFIYYSDFQEPWQYQFEYYINREWGSDFENVITQYAYFRGSSDSVSEKIKASLSHKTI